MAAARVHADADGSTSLMAHRTGLTQRTHQRWSSRGVGSPQDQYDLYLMTCDNPWRGAAHVRAVAKVRSGISKLTTKNLIDRLHELLQMEKPLEARDTSMDLARGVNLLDRAQMAEKDAAIDEEKAAIYYELAARGVTEREIFG